ncbi:MAG: tetratricopeptide repeat protein, partial [Gemmatimonadota bacterium]
KSRFTAALVEHARRDGFLAIEGACFEADRGHPYAPLLDLVQRLAARSSSALAAHAFESAGTELVTLFPELRSIFPDALPQPSTGPEEDRRRLFHSFTEAIRALARVQPLLLVIEDVHWSDDATLDLMLHVARNIGTASIALVLTFRSDEVGPRLSRLLAEFDRARCASEVGLRPLGTGELATMLQAIFGTDASLGAQFVDALHSLTEGNPFFIEEVLKSLLVAGDLAQSDGTWRARPLEAAHVPRTATEAVARRLADLSEEASRIASVAAVAGRRFDFRLLQAVTNHPEAELLPLLKELVQAQIVVEESADQFAFRHALTREAIRARLLARERIGLHRAIATALEGWHDPDSLDGDDAMAYHTFEAGSWESARHFALRAAARALALSAPREALQHFDRAIAATEHTGNLPDAAMLVDRGRAHETLGAFPQANDDFNGALRAARAVSDRHAEWGALHALGLLWAARDYQRAGDYRRQALEVARAIGDPLLIARSLNRVGNWFVNREDPQSGIPHHDEALAIFERTGDPRGVVETVDLLAMAHHCAGDEETAVPLYERAIRLFTAIDDRRGLTNALSVLPVCGPSHHASAGPVCESARSGELRATERAVHLAGNLGWRAGEAFSRYLLADCLAWRGDFRRAFRLARESLAIAQEIEHREWQCGARRVLGVMAADLLAPAEALIHLEAAHQIAQRLGSAIWIRWTGAPYAIALARSGQVDAASAVLREMDERVHPVADAPPQTLGERFVTLARAELALASGAPADAITILGAGDIGTTPRATLLRGEALVALEQWNDALEALDLARDRAELQQANPLLWRIAALQGTIHLARRRRIEARRSFDAARAIAEIMVSELDEPSLVSAFRNGVDELAPPPPPRTPRQAAKEAHGGLTRRERDTAALIAQGLANRAIARTLGIGERTVEGYVASSLAKLGFSSRSQLAVWATAQGLNPPPGGPKPPRH